MVLVEPFFFFVVVSWNSRFDVNFKTVIFCFDLVFLFTLLINFIKLLLKSKTNFI